MKIRTIYYSLDISPEEEAKDENNNSFWSTDSDRDRTLGFSGSYTPMNDAIFFSELNPTTYNRIKIEAGESKPVLEDSKLLNMLFIKNIGENSVFLGFNGDDADFPIKLLKNDTMHFRGAETYIMSQLLAKSTLGSELLFLFTSDAEFNLILQSSTGSHLIDSDGREIVGYL